MKAMGELLPRDPTIVPQDELSRMQLRQEQQSQERLQKSAEIVDLWQIMGSMYGHKWTSNYGDIPDPDKVWYAALRDLRWEQIKKGLNRVATLGSEWPPSVPEFRKMCLGIESGVSVARAPSAADTKERLRALEHKRSPEQITEATRKLSDIRASLHS